MKRRILVLILFSLISESLYSQIDSTTWYKVKVFEYKSSSYPDTLEICGGEWFVKISANEFNKLTNAELVRIKKKVAAYGCDYVFVDIKNHHRTTKKGVKYILGLKRKK